VRGTTRTDSGLEAIEAAGVEAAIADPDRVGTVYDHLDAVALVYWLMGSARGDSGEAAAVNGPRLERLLEKVVDTPVRGFVYEGAGTAPRAALAEGARLVGEAGERWRIPVEVVTADPADQELWRAEMLAAAERLTGR
jgi:hypothetical protein